MKIYMWNNESSREEKPRTTLDEYETLTDRPNEISNKNFHKFESPRRIFLYTFKQANEEKNISFV